MFKKMVTGKFDFDEMINQFKAAAQAEFKSPAPLTSRRTLYKPETAAAGHDMEALRDAYMLDSILKGKQSGIPSLASATGTARTSRRSSRRTTPRSPSKSTAPSTALSTTSIRM